MITSVGVCNGVGTLNTEQTKIGVIKCILIVAIRRALFHSFGPR